MKVQKILNRISLTALVFGAVFINNCTNNLNPQQTETPVPGAINSSALINMPTSLSSVTRAATDSQDGADEIYNLIRWQNYFVNQLVNSNDFGVKWIIEKLVAPLPWNVIEQTGIYDTIIGNAHFVATYKADSLYKYNVLLQDLSPGNPYTVKAAFNGSAINPRGWVYYFIDNPEDQRTDSLVIRVDFNKNGTERWLTVDITQKLLKKIRDMVKTFRYSLYAQDATIHLSASTYYPYLDSILKDTTGYCYTYTATADTLKNQAIIRLGIPPSVYNDTTLIFSHYDVANSWGSAIINYWLPSMNDTLKQVVVTSYKDSLSIEQIFHKLMTDTTFKLHPSSEMASITPDDFKFFLWLNRNISDPKVKKDFASLLWILKLSQPVYFNASGYAGNGTVIPPAFVALAAIKCNRPVFIPSGLVILKISDVK